MAGQKNTLVPKRTVAGEEEVVEVEVSEPHSCAGPTFHRDRCNRNTCRPQPSKTLLPYEQSRFLVVLLGCLCQADTNRRFFVPD